MANVIGHNESLSSPYHLQRIAALRNQTHGDRVRADMRSYRAELRRLGGQLAVMRPRSSASRPAPHG